MTEKVYALDTKPGVQRDGTDFDKNFYNSGRWVRFQRGRPRKVGGYREISGTLAGPSRGIYVNPQNAFTNVFSGYSDGLQVLPIDNNGVGSGVTDFTLSNFDPSDLNLWQFDTFSDVTGSNNNLLIAHPGQNLAQIDNSENTPVLGGPLTGTTLSQIGSFQDSNAFLNSTTSVTISQADYKIGAGQTVTGTGIPANTTVVSVVSEAPNLSGTSVTGIAGQMACTATSGLFVGQSVTISGTLTGTATGLVSGVTYYIIATNYSTTFTLSATAGGSAITTTAGTTTGLVFTLGLYTKVVLNNAATTTGNSTLTFNNNISVSGGIVSLHPYLFVYGNNGLIKNCSSGNLEDWVSTDANEVNIATGKIVQGLPVRGGSNAPSGLFWSLDSLIRVSYNPTTINVGTTAVTQYWRYDIISSQSSILSSQCVIEYDGIYYWIGVDRFLLYNGVVKEIENDMNQNYFFDNLNYAQRQKIWATKVPRYGEIWWFYPRGDATECTDAIIFNVREQCWYDAGEALGARRSAGYFSQVFHYPINASWEKNLDGAIQTSSITDAGSSYTNGTYSYISLSGGTGTGATATITVSGGIVTDAVIENKGQNYVIGDALSASIPGGANFELTVDSIESYISLYQHEFGTDAIKSGLATAIESYFETNDLGWVSGGPSQPSMEGMNRWIHLERVEPDFIQSGEMELYVTGPPYADESSKKSGPYVFQSNTGKIDLREQRREMRLIFRSNVQGGDYQLGKVLLNANIGDKRGYST
jgi:hypothetical protein